MTSFLLEGRADPSLEREELSDLEDERDSREVVNNLLLDAQIWRPANSAHWIAWGIIQANLPEMGDPVSDIVQEQIEEKQGFDYLGYARDRALFFWGDLLQLGIINEAELPSELKGRIKMVPVMTGTIPNSDRPSAPATIEA